MKKLIDLKSFFLSLILISVISLLLNYFTNMGLLPAFIIGTCAILINGVIIAFTEDK